MAPGSRCMSGNTYGCRMSWAYRWAVMVARINTMGERVLKAMEPHTITLAVGAVCRCKANKGLRRSSRSSFLVRGTTPNGGIDGWVSRAAHVIGTTIPNVLRPGAFVGFEDTQGLIMKVLPVPGWWPMKQLAVRVHFLRCGGLLDDWSVEGVLSLVFV
ncbi:e3 ubiquitin-protein ligase RNF13 [Trichonephila clavipes]|nr:e3 ubiquitin-protein ligase RNF13 [Trichonephila clavipes]